MHANITFNRSRQFSEMKAKKVENLTEALQNDRTSDDDVTTKGIEKTSPTTVVSTIWQIKTNYLN